MKQQLKIFPKVFDALKSASGPAIVATGTRRIGY